MAHGYKYDERPLFAPGRHFLDLTEVKEICVVPFSQSRTRSNLFQRMEELVQELLRRAIICDVMVDGSFLTEKIDPVDIDIAVHIQFDFSEQLKANQRELLNELLGDSYIEGLDTFVEVEYPRDHGEFADWKAEKSWGEQWGIEHGKVWCKGVVVLRLWETDVGLRIRR